MRPKHHHVRRTLALVAAVLLAFTACGPASDPPAAAGPVPASTSSSTSSSTSVAPPTEARLVNAAGVAQAERFYLGLERQAEARAAELARIEAAEAAARAEAARVAERTTTTATTATPAPSATTAPPASASSTPATGICGGDLPPCYVVNRESGGDPRIWNGSCYAPVGWTGKSSPCGGSTASGIYQFVRGTWAGYGGYLNAADAPVHVQVAKAREVWAGGRGCSHWSAC